MKTIDITIRVNENEVCGDCYKCKYSYGAKILTLLEKHLVLSKKEWLNNY